MDFIDNLIYPTPIGVKFDTTFHRATYPNITVLSVLQLKNVIFFKSTYSFKVRQNTRTHFVLHFPHSVEYFHFLKRISPPIFHNFSLLSVLSELSVLRNISLQCIGTSAKPLSTALLQSTAPLFHHCPLPAASNSNIYNA